MSGLGSKELEGHGRPKVSELPPNIKALVYAAQNSLRLRIALKHGWSTDSVVSSGLLPTADEMISASLRDACTGSRTLSSTYLMLHDQTGRGSNSNAHESLTKKVYTLVNASYYQ